MKSQILLFLLLLGVTTTFSQSFPGTPTSLEDVRPWIERNLQLNSTKVLDSIITRPDIDPQVVWSRRTHEYDLLARQKRLFYGFYSLEDPSELAFGYELTTEYGTRVKVETSRNWFDQWSGKTRTTDSLDENGRLLAQLTERETSQSMDFVSSKWTVYQYRDGTDQLSMRLIYQMNDGEWEASQRQVFTYNAQDSLILEETYVPSGIDDWFVNEYVEYDYDAFGNLTSKLTFRWLLSDAEYRLDREENYWYNSDGLQDSLLVKTSIISPSTSAYMIAYEYEGELIKVVKTYDWDLFSDAVNLIQRVELFYDADEDIIQTKSISFDFDTGQEGDHSTSDYYYSAINVATQEVNKTPAFVCQTANPHTPGQAITCQTSPDQIAPTTARVYDLQGRLHWSEKLTPQDGVWDVYLTTQLPSGLYLLVWESPQGVVGQQKLLIP